MNSMGECDDHSPQYSTLSRGVLLRVKYEDFISSIGPSKVLDPCMTIPFIMVGISERP